MYVFWVISVYFNIRNILPKSDTFLLGHPVYVKVKVKVKFTLKQAMKAQRGSRVIDLFVL